MICVHDAMNRMNEHTYDKMCRVASAVVMMYHTDMIAKPSTFSHQLRILHVLKRFAIQRSARTEHVVILSKKTQRVIHVR
jgi:hypothetical protein